MRDKETNPAIPCACYACGPMGTPDSHWHLHRDQWNVNPHFSASRSSTGATQMSPEPANLYVVVVLQLYCKSDKNGKTTSKNKTIFASLKIRLVIL